MTTPGPDRRPGDQRRYAAGALRSRAAVHHTGHDGAVGAREDGAVAADPPALRDVGEDRALGRHTARAGVCRVQGAVCVHADQRPRRIAQQPLRPRIACDHQASRVHGVHPGFHRLEERGQQRTTRDGAVGGGCDGIRSWMALRSRSPRIPARGRASCAGPVRSRMHGTPPSRRRTPRPPCPALSAPAADGPARRDPPAAHGRPTPRPAASQGSGGGLVYPLNRSVGTDAPIRHPAQAGAITVVREPGCSVRSSSAGGAGSCDFTSSPGA